jgi:hypothetical protein
MRLRIEYLVDGLLWLSWLVLVGYALSLVFDGVDCLERGGTYAVSPSGGGCVWGRR